MCSTSEPRIVSVCLKYSQKSLSLSLRSLLSPSLFPSLYLVPISCLYLWFLSLWYIYIYISLSLSLSLSLVSLCSLVSLVSRFLYLSLSLSPSSVSLSLSLSDRVSPSLLSLSALSLSLSLSSLSLSALSLSLNNLKLLHNFFGVGCYSSGSAGSKKPEDDERQTNCKRAIHGNDHENRREEMTPKGVREHELLRRTKKLRIGKPRTCQIA